MVGIVEQRQDVAQPQRYRGGDEKSAVERRERAERQGRPIQSLLRRRHPALSRWNARWSGGEFHVAANTARRHPGANPGGSPPQSWNFVLGSVAPRLLYSAVMKRLTRYMLGQTLVVMIFVAIAFSAAVWLVQSLRLIDLIVNRGLSVGLFIYLALLILPR